MHSPLSQSSAMYVTDRLSDFQKKLLLLVLIDYFINVFIEYVHIIFFGEYK
jgi:hypothetical protein